MKKNNQSLEVLEPEVEEIPLEQVINNSLVKHNVTDAVIASLKDRYGALRLNDIEDKESYLEIKEARKEVRKVGILVEKLCKKGREDAVAIQRKWLAKEKEVLAKVSEVEYPLNTEIEKFENEVERKELLEAKKREEVYINRQSTLLKYGAQYNNGSFELKHISYEVELIKQADEEQWNDTILPKYRKVYEEIETTRVEEENKRKAEMDRLKLEQYKFVEEQRLFTQQREEFAKQQKELQDSKDKHEREQRIEQERKDSEEKKKRIETYNSRVKQLTDLGLVSVDGYNFKLEDINVCPVTEINHLNDIEFEEFINNIKPDIEQRKKDAEEKRLSLIEQQKNDAIAKALDDEKIRKQNEQNQKELELAQAKDRDKWIAFINEVKMIPHSEMKSPMYKSKQSKAKELIEQILSL
jgi:hypothetical protein